MIFSSKKRSGWEQLICLKLFYFFKFTLIYDEACKREKYDNSVINEYERECDYKE